MACNRKALNTVHALHTHTHTHTHTHAHTHSLKSILILSSLIFLCLLSGPFSSGFSIVIVDVSLHHKTLRNIIILTWVGTTVVAGLGCHVV
jgi:hypothetical protein